MKLIQKKKNFRLENTGKDLEIISTIQSNKNIDINSLKDFDKGDGIDFLNDELSLDIQKGCNLICGDTKSDVPMINAVLKKNKNIQVIFVSNDNKLKKQVLDIKPNSIFVTEPDVIITILNDLACYTEKP